MPSLPPGEPAAAVGLLPGSAIRGAHERTFGVYVHVPFCATRCGYCDFNTYTVSELGPGVSPAAYAELARAEVRWAADRLAASGLPPRQVRTVFFGGGTPTVLASADLVSVLAEVRVQWGVASGCEVTTEANPDSVTPDALAELAAGGFTRVSFGMQSAVPGVLATLDRTHDPARVADAVGWAKHVGLATSLDLIYGTPGESRGDWARSVRAAVELSPDHLSAYALGIEDGTRMARQVSAGLISPTDPDDQASKYELAEEILSGAGYSWYEISNWALGPQQHCRHNLGYWRGDDWWGIGPGAHSHVGGIRWWNVKHPRQYAKRIAAGVSPAQEREVLSDADRRLEDVMLRLRLAEGLPVDRLATVTDQPRAAIEAVVSDGLGTVRQGAGSRPEHLVLTVSGRMLADQVLRRLLGW